MTGSLYRLKHRKKYKNEKKGPSFSRECEPAGSDVKKDGPFLLDRLSGRQPPCLPECAFIPPGSLPVSCRYWHSEQFAGDRQ